MNEKLIKYLSGSSKDQFDLLYECIMPYLHSVTYVNEIPVMLAFTSDKCISTIQKVCNSWVVFLATFFNQIDPKAEKEFLIKICQKLYWETAHEETHLVIHAIEYKSQQGSNYDLSNFFFQFQNTTAGRVLVNPGIA